MAEERNLLVGVDLCDDYSQISCFNTTTYEPESICPNRDKDKYLVPTVLFYKRDNAQWYFGDEALHVNKKAEGVFIENILTKVIKGECFQINGKDVQPEYILEKFLKRLLSLLKLEYPNNTIRQLVITVKQKNMTLIQHIYQALQNLGISRLRASVISHEQAFVHYAMNQPKELRSNDVGMFDFGEDGMMFYQISINRRTKPHSVLLKKKNFQQTLSYDLLEDEISRENATYLFESIAIKALHKQIISTIYVTGKGFDGKWCQPVLKNMCSTSRVFMGQNLYAKGAGYAARDTLGEGRLNEYLYLGDEMLPVNISIPVYTNNREEEYPLVTAGTAWYNASNRIRFIPDNEMEIEIIVEYVVERQIRRHFIAMDGLHRLDRKTIIELSIEFLDIHTCVIRLNDRGFGELFPSSNRVWEKTLHIAGNEKIEKE